MSGIGNMKTMSQQAITAGVFAAAGMSCINLNPMSFLNFLNSAELYSYIIVYKLDISSDLIGFLNELVVASMVPNLFTYLVSDNEGLPLGTNENNFGINSNLFLINSGVNLTIFIVSVTILLFAIILEKAHIRFINAMIKKLIGSFKYRYFLRFWLQTCLEFSFNSVVGIAYTSLANHIQIIDVCICISILVKAT